MRRFSRLSILKHFLGIGTIAGIYAAQAFHLHELVDMEIIVVLYLFALLAYYIILYGCESGIFSLATPQSRRLYIHLRASIAVVNVFLSALGYFYRNSVHFQSLPSISFLILLFLFMILFPEVLLPLIFNICPRPPEPPTASGSPIHIQ